MDEQIRAGKIFIYPTDTIYGIGCDATNEEAVQKIRALKQRETKPFSVIPPSAEWIVENCIRPADKGDTSWPPASGPFTYFVRTKNNRCVAPGIDEEKTGTLGLRMTNRSHWFMREIARAGVPFVSTSVNISGKPHMTSLTDLDPHLAEKIDIIIYEGPLVGKPSQKIDLTKG